MSTTLDKQIILNMLADLKRSDRQFKKFGACLHQYELQPPISEAEVNAFESKHKIQLPADYRYFITEVGNGGAGPYYGIFPFGYHDDLRSYCTWERGGMVGDLSIEFAHREKWNLPESFWRKKPNPGPDVSLEEEDRLMEQWDHQLEEHYWNPRIMNGAIPICHLGCALRQWLVIHGPKKGFVWADDRADHAGIYPLRDQNDRQLTFADWYMSWLAQGG